MSAVVVPLLSIGAITIVVSVARRTLGIRMCPICAGVAGTWLWMLIGRELGASFDASLLPFLMGGSVVGVVYQLEGAFPAGRPAVLWKDVAMPIGFAVAYALEQQLWTLLAAALTALIVVATFLWRQPSAATGDSAVIDKLKERMKQCC